MRTPTHRQNLVNSLLILIWIATCLGIAAPLTRTFDATSSVTNFLMLMLYFGFISVFLLNTIYFFALAAACLADAPPQSGAAELQVDPVSASPVAILYTVKDDFDATALQACIDQDHSATTVF